MKSNKGKGLLGLLGLLVVLGIFGFFGYDTLQKSKLVTDENGVTSQNGGIKLGLDLAGGVSITYQAKEENPSAEDMSDTQYKLQQRVQNYSSEAEVYQEGGNRINVDIPGVTDANKILEELGKPGSLQFYDENWNVVLEGTDVASAKAVIYKDQQTGNNNYEVALTFTDEGTKKFADVTAANVGKKIAIVYDNVMYSNPTVQQAITGGQASISGMTSYEEAENLASTIRIGSLSLELEELRSNVVGAKLGQEAITTSLKAGAIGFGIVCVFMIVVYLIPGLAASLALCLYVALMLILLAAYAGKSLHTHPDEYYRYLTENDANTTSPALVDDCAICHFHFFSYIHSTDWVLDSEFRLLETFFRPECYDPAIVAISGSQLRAPPAIG